MADLPTEDNSNGTTENFGGEVHSDEIMIICSIAAVLVLAFIAVLIAYFVIENDDKADRKCEEQKKDELYRQESLKI